MVPVQDITFELHSKLNEWYSVLKSFDISVLLVFDGARNPTKASTSDTRRKSQDKARYELKKVLKEVENADPKQILKLCSEATLF